MNSWRRCSRRVLYCQQRYRWAQLRHKVGQIDEPISTVCPATVRWPPCCRARSKSIGLGRRSADIAPPSDSLRRCAGMYLHDRWPETPARTCGGEYSTIHKLSRSTPNSACSDRFNRPNQDRTYA